MKRLFDFVIAFAAPIVELAAKMLNSGTHPPGQFPPWVGPTWICERPCYRSIRMRRKRLAVTPTIVDGLPNGPIHLEIPFENLNLPWQGRWHCPDVSESASGPASLAPTPGNTLHTANTLTLTVCGEEFVFKKKTTLFQSISQWFLA
jgi:hypothetical protein